MRDIHERAFAFACRIVKLYRTINRQAANRVIASQLLRSGTAIGANLEEGKAAQSRADFIARVRISLKEARESLYWLRVVEACEIVVAPRIQPLVAEANEIVAILTAIVKNASKTTSPRRILNS